ncbi:MAG: O-antigen ligase family protein [Desulfosporosinus sp.]|nr:O-antigen ligase family protein [Desulfosporosinus sp.]
MDLTLLKWVALRISIGIVTYLGIKRPSILISLLAGAAAFEISVTWFPLLEPLSSQTVFSLARILTFGIVLAALWQLWFEQEKRQKLKVILTLFLSRALLIYIAVGAFSLLYSVGRGQTVIEVVRLLTFFLLYLGVCLLADPNHALLPFQVVHWVGVALVPLALYERMTSLSWHLMVNNRVNATFVDSNIFARYLVLAMVANLILQYFKHVVWKRSLYLGSLCGLVGALAITLSRSGFVTLVIVLVLLLLLIPRKQMVQPIGLMALIGAGIVAVWPIVWQRLLTIKDEFGAFSERKDLWRASWAMFTNHPISGVGLGGFQKMFLTTYSSFWKGGEVTLSHTTLLTIAAELGILGLTALALIWFALIWTLRSLRSLDKNGVERYLPGVGYFLWILTIFISSQSEARFFEDPVLWISMGMMVSLSHGVEKEKEDTSRNSVQRCSSR